MVRTPGAICSAFEMRDFGSEQGLLDGCQASHTVPHPGDSVTGSSDVQSLEGSDRRPHTNEHTEHFDRPRGRDQSSLASRDSTIQDANVSSVVSLASQDSGHDRPDGVDCTTIIYSGTDTETPPRDRVQPQYKPRLAGKYLASHFEGTVRWWIPELLASLLSLASLIAIITILLVCDRRAVADLGFPTGLTLNAVIAILATIGRAGLGVPVCSGILQEMWLYLSTQSAKEHPKSCLNDLELFFRASYGALGSLEYLLKVRPNRYVVISTRRPYN